MVEKVKGSILIIEDELKLLNLLSKQLSREGFLISKAKDCFAAEQELNEQIYDLIILDINLPHKSGFEFLNELREGKNNTPVLILSARNKIEDKIKGLTFGADDYLPKPFDYGELLARVNAILNRTGRFSATKLIVSDLEMDLIERKVKRDQKMLELTQREFDLLEYFLKNKNQILTNKRLAEQVWGYTFNTGTNVVNVYVNYLRNAIDDGFEKKLLKTVRGQGFILADD